MNEDIQILNTNGLEDFKLFDISGKQIPITIKDFSDYTRIKTDGLISGFYLLKSNQKVFKIILK